MSEITITEPSLFLRISQAYDESLLPIELYDYTRGQWKVNLKRASQAKYAFAISEKVIREVYEIFDWYPAGKTFSTRHDNSRIKRGALEGLNKRLEFIGNLASEQIREKYLTKSVSHYYKHGNANPIMYLNI